MKTYNGPVVSNPPNGEVLFEIQHKFDGTRQTRSHSAYAAVMSLGWRMSDCAFIQVLEEAGSSV